MRIVLVRHYRTEFNKENRILGWRDSPPSPGWEAHVDFVEQSLRENGVEFDAVYSSDLRRSNETAKKYAAAFGIEDVIVEPALKEINYGEVQTRLKSWVKAQYPRHKKDPDMVYPGGESFRQMQRRSVDFINTLAMTHPRQTILVVSHAGVIRGLVCHYLGLDYARCLKHNVSFRYIGDFQFEGSTCLRYDELGRPSGFARDDAIEVPFSNTVIADADIAS
jgi:alpha-ribazole phosphatase